MGKIENPFMIKLEKGFESVGIRGLDPERKLFELLHLNGCPDEKEQERSENI
ncbi:MAG: hypothetical protein ACREOO_15080 [bacterium]